MENTEKQKAERKKRQSKKEKIMDEWNSIKWLDNEQYSDHIARTSKESPKYKGSQQGHTAVDKETEARKKKRVKHTS